jgi:hypothetical protein
MFCTDGLDIFQRHSFEHLHVVVNDLWCLLVHDFYIFSFERFGDVLQLLHVFPAQIMLHKPDSFLAGLLALLDFCVFWVTFGQVLRLVK